MDDSLFEARLNNHDILINTLAKSQANMDRNFTLLTEILQRVVEQQERHSAEMKAINERLDAQEGQIKVLIEQFVNGFNMQTFREMIDAFNSKFEAVFAELKENEARFEQIFQKFAENDAKFEKFFAELERLDQQIAEQNSHIRSLLEIIRKKLEM